MGGGHPTFLFLMIEARPTSSSPFRAANPSARGRGPSFPPCAKKARNSLHGDSVFPPFIPKGKPSVPVMRSDEGLCPLTPLFFFSRYFVGLISAPILVLVPLRRLPCFLDCSIIEGSVFLLARNGGWPRCTPLPKKPGAVSCDRAGPPSDILPLRTDRPSRA